MNTFDEKLSELAQEVAEKISSKAAKKRIKPIFEQLLEKLNAFNAALKTAKENPSFDAEAIMAAKRDLLEYTYAMTKNLESKNSSYSTIAETNYQSKVSPGTRTKRKKCSLPFGVSIRLGKNPGDVILNFRVVDKRHLFVTKILCSSDVGKTWEDRFCPFLRWSNILFEGYPTASTLHFKLCIYHNGDSNPEFTDVIVVDMP